MVNLISTTSEIIMGLYTFFISNFVFPFHEFIKKHDSVKVRKKLERYQWLSREEIEKIQIEKLKSFLADVELNVPYYRNLFKSIRFDPGKVNSLDALVRLPFLNKSEIRSNSEQLKAENAGGLARYNTGGSSGEPLVFYIGKDRVTHDVAAKWRATRWWDVDIGDPEIVIWGSPVELGSQDIIKLLRDKILRSHLVPAFEMSEKNLDHFISQIKAIQPKMLFGYPSALAHIATHAEKNGITFDELDIKVAFVTSERLYDHQREKIETIFSCPVANGYGGRDSGFIAHQCPAGSMHISAEDIIVEIIDKNGHILPKGQAGEIVVTHLSTHDYPFIRYRTGDVGVLSDETCSCGRGLPILKEIQGRTTDFVVAQDGTVLHGLALIYVLRDMQGIAAFKIIQQSKKTTVVQIVKNKNFNSETIAKIKEQFKKRLGTEVDVVVEFHNQISKEKSGKFRYVISKVEI